MSFAATLNRYLPPPGILRIGGLGVDVSESSIKYVAFSPSHKGLFALSLSSYGEVDLGPNVLRKGEVDDVSALAAALAEVKKRSGHSYFRLSLPEERIYLFETEIEDITNKVAARQQLEFRLEENVPLSPRDAYFDFSLTPLDDSGRRARATVTVSAREIVDKYYEACRLAKVTPLSFEVESAALARAVLPEGDPGTKLLVDFGKTRTGIGIVSGGELLHTSTIEQGGNDLSAALKRQLGDKDESTLTRLKNEEGLVGTSAESLLPVVSIVKDEIASRLRYWNDANPTRLVDQVLLSGGSANLRGLTSYLTETLGVEADMANVWQNAFDPKLTTPPIDRRHSFGFATAIGLALTSYHT